MKVFVVGGSGFVGRRVVSRLVAAGEEVVASARSETAASKIASAGGHAVDGDLEEHGSVEAALQEAQPDALVSSVSLAMGFGPSLVSAAERAGVRRAVFVSTTSIYTKLDSASKPVRLAAEDAIRSSTLDWTILRPTMIYGASDDRNIARLLRFMQRSPVMPLPGGGKGLQQPVHVDDVADAIVAALKTDAAIGKAYEIAGPEAMPFKALLQACATALGRKVRFIPAPLRPLITAARIGERSSRFPLRAEQFERLAEDKAFDITDARTDLGFSPRSFADGVGAEAASLRSR